MSPFFWNFANGIQNCQKKATSVCFLQTANGNGNPTFFAANRNGKTKVCLPSLPNDKL
jgi:hypothetical protein